MEANCLFVLFFLALTPTTLHALSKVVMNNSESSEDIISVIKNIVNQFQSKCATVPDTEGIDISLNVRLWRISGFHEMLASLGFDLMDVGQDQVTLRTGKQANRRNCQFVLQALLALFDTQEAPKALESCSSTESLDETSESDVKSQQLQRLDEYQQNKNTSMSNISTISSASGYQKMATSARSAFISYVRRRGEPDGGHTDPLQSQKLKPPTFDSSLNNTDSELSDGYTTQQMLAKFTNSSKELCYSGLRGTIKICRPGGGGESDAAFTPSPPIQTIDNNVSMALAHQTRIRNLYTNSNETLGVKEKGGNSRRPDSSSSASSATDWDSGHATVLRRAHLQQQQSNKATLPMPPPRQLPMIDNLRPLAPVYNNLMAQSGLGMTTMAKVKSAAAFLESTSSESEGFDMLRKLPSQTRSKIKIHQQYIQHHQQQNNQGGHYQEMPSVSVAKLKEQFSFMDRLSVRSTELNGTVPNNVSKAAAACSSMMQLMRKPMLKPTDEEGAMSISGNNLYFSPAELQNAPTNLVEEEPAVTHHPQVHPHHKSKEIKTGVATASVPAAQSASTSAPSTKRNVQDSILRHMNRDHLTPTISDVYHDRNIGYSVVSAPPLSKLLMSTNYDDNDNNSNLQSDSASPTSSNQALNKMINSMDLSDDVEVVSSVCTTSTAKMLICGTASNSDEDFSTPELSNGSKNQMTKSMTMKKNFSPPWLSSITTENIIKPSELTTADILAEQQNKMKSSSSTGGNSSNSTATTVKSPYSEFMRDDADGHSNSGCSAITNSTPKSSLQRN